MESKYMVADEHYVRVLVDGKPNLLCRMDGCVKFYSSEQYLLRHAKSKHQMLGFFSSLNAADAGTSRGRGKGENIETVHGYCYDYPRLRGNVWVRWRTLKRRSKTVISADAERAWSVLHGCSFGRGTPRPALLDKEKWTAYRAWKSREKEGILEELRNNVYGVLTGPAFRYNHDRAIQEGRVEDPCLDSSDSDDNNEDFVAPRLVFCPRPIKAVLPGVNVLDEASNEDDSSSDRETDDFQVSSPKRFRFNTPPVIIKLNSPPVDQSLEPVSNSDVIVSSEGKHIVTESNSDGGHVSDTSSEDNNATHAQEVALPHPDVEPPPNSPTSPLFAIGEFVDEGVSFGITETEPTSNAGRMLWLPRLRASSEEPPRVRLQTNCRIIHNHRQRRHSAANANGIEMEILRSSFEEWKSSLNDEGGVSETEEDTDRFEGETITFESSQLCPPLTPDLMKGLNVSPMEDSVFDGWTVPKQQAAYEERSGPNVDENCKIDTNNFLVLTTPDSGKSLCSSPQFEIPSQLGTPCISLPQLSQTLPSICDIDVNVGTDSELVDITKEYCE